MASSPWDLLPLWCFIFKTTGLDWTSSECQQCSGKARPQPNGSLLSFCLSHICWCPWAGRSFLVKPRVFKSVRTGRFGSLGILGVTRPLPQTHQVTRVGWKCMIPWSTSSPDVDQAPWNTSPFDSEACELKRQAAAFHTYTHGERETGWLQQTLWIEKDRGT